MLLAFALGAATGAILSSEIQTDENYGDIDERFLSKDSVPPCVMAMQNRGEFSCTNCKRRNNCAY